MKKMIVAMLMLVTVSVKAQTFSEFIASEAKTAEVDSAFNLNGGKYAAAYLPVRSLNIPWANVADVGGGGVFGAGKPDGLVAFRLNLPQLANGLFGTSWFTSHTTGPVLPTLFLGPAVKAAWPIDQWTWKQDVFLLAGIPLSALP